jgi:TetR/AcrR family transcriptional regulator, lmrAB and yxaGH operons repressor
MAKDVRTRMVEGAASLLAKDGLQGTSFSEVLELTGTPRGSIYHHFPNGKDQLVASAIDLAGDRAITLLDGKAGSSAEEITRYFLHIWREVLKRSAFQSGCAVLAVTVATDSPELLARASTIFREWRARLGELLEEGGMPAAEASRFAATLVAASEGAVVMARAERSLAPFELVAELLIEQASTTT